MLLHVHERLFSGAVRSDHAHRQQRPQPDRQLVGRNELDDSPGSDHPCHYVAIRLVTRTRRGAMSPKQERRGYFPAFSPCGRPGALTALLTSAAKQLFGRLKYSRTARERLAAPRRSGRCQPNLGRPLSFVGGGATASGRSTKFDKR